MKTVWEINGLLSLSTYGFPLLLWYKAITINIILKASKITTLATGLITCQFRTYGNMPDPQELLSKNLAYSKIHMLDKA